MPRSKEVPFFSRENPNPAYFHAEVSALRADAPTGSLVGKVTPSYMIGGQALEGEVSVETVAKRIAESLPKVKLIAVLRDPIERAVSGYTMAFRRGQEKRSVDVALSELLDPEKLERARLGATFTNSYVIAGEYGRILSTYRAVFPPDRLLVLFTEDLARAPGEVLDSTLGYLGLPAGFRPQGLGVHHFRGGRRRLLDSRARESLFKFHREEILPHLRGSPDAHQRAFEFFFSTWNAAPDDDLLEVSPDLRERLERHFRIDAERLDELGIGAPWIANWEVSQS